MCAWCSDCLQCLGLPRYDQWPMLFCKALSWTSLWIKASAKCVNVIFTTFLNASQNVYIVDETKVQLCDTKCYVQSHLKMTQGFLFIHVCFKLVTFPDHTATSRHGRLQEAAACIWVTLPVILDNIVLQKCQPNVLKRATMQSRVQMSFVLLQTNDI